MRINKFISYILCNKGMIVNLYKLHFPSFLFFSPTKQKSFLSSHFSTPPTKHIRGKTIIFSILPQFSILPLFHSSIQTECKAKSYYMKERDGKVQLIQCLPESSKGLNKDFLIVSGAWHDCLSCPTEEGASGGVLRVGEG